MDFPIVDLTVDDDGLRQRDGDQPLPIGNDLPSMHQKAMDALDSRRELGIRRYGQPLQPANGRNAALDAWEEALDGASYGAQVVWEQDNPEHTYVGAIVDALVGAIADHAWDGEVNFGSMFVPESVLILLRKYHIDYTQEKES